MNPKFKIFKTLENSGAIYLRGLNKENSDLDFFANKDCLPLIHEKLKKINVFLLKKTPSKYTYFYATLSNIVRVDIEFNFDYIFKYFKGISFKKNFVQSYLSNPQSLELKFNTIRYIYLFRKKLCYINYLKQNWNKIEREGYLLITTSAYPFKKELKWHDLEKLFGKKPLAFFKIIKLRYLKSYLSQLLKEISQVVWSGNTVAILGPDGVGKTTIVSLLNNLLYSKKIYMGNNDFILNRLYLRLPPKKIPLLFKFLLIYFENLIKLFKALWGKFSGKTVIFDRYPSYQYLQKKNVGFFLTKFFYKYLFLKPDKIVVLYNTSDIVINRKNELKKIEIDLIQENYRNLFKKNKNVLFVKNDNINVTLKKVIEFVL